MARLLTSKEVADLLRVSEKHVSRLRNLGLPSLKLGRTVRFREEDLMAFIDQATYSAPTGPEESPHA